MEFRKNVLNNLSFSNLQKVYFGIGLGYLIQNHLEACDGVYSNMPLFTPEKYGKMISTMATLFHIHDFKGCVGDDYMYSTMRDGYNLLVSYRRFTELNLQDHSQILDHLPKLHLDLMVTR